MSTFFQQKSSVPLRGVSKTLESLVEQFDKQARANLTPGQVEIIKRTHLNAREINEIFSRARKLVEAS